MFDITVDGGISIHAPQWGATLLDGCGLAYRAISIHAPQWGATSRRLATCTRRSYFNPRTPVGCDPANPTREAYNQISIHAPQWGATRRGQRFDRHRQQYFNPRTPVGCDMKNLNNDPSRNVFQSTHPSGVRQTFEAHGVQGLSISIHAPQWGATMPLEAAALAY